MIANQAPNFSAGANLMLLLMTAQEGEWDDIHLAVRQFQRANMAIKYAPRPVVAAPQGMALGGGCEISCTPREFMRRRKHTSGWWKWAWD